MPAPATKTLLVLALLAAACASNPPDSAPKPSVAQEGPAPDRYAPPAPATLSPMEELDDLEASLAAYEAQLAQNEARLQAMGVRIARAEPAIGDADKADDNRFAPPPPPRPRDAPAASVTSTPAQPAPAKPGRSERGKAKKTAGAAEGDAPRGDTARQSGGGREATSRTPNSPPATKSAPARDESLKDGEGGRCADLCDLAHATCDLEAKICDLAARHVDEPRYGEVCQRAGDDCRAAADACTLCSP